jgi:Tfp pilus assembly protein PilO
MVIAPLALLIVFWMFVLSPKRDEAAKLGDQLSEVEGQRDTAVQQADAAEGAKTSFAADYAAVVRLGKAIPSKIDMPSLLVQLERAARGTHIDFARMTVGERAAATAPAAQAPTAQAPAAPAGDAAAGGEPAQSAPGKAAENAQNTVNGANAQAEQAGQQTGEPAAGQPAPAAGGAAAPPASGPAPAAPGLESIPLDFSFRGRFFDLANFFHELKRFVYVAGDGKVVVRGRLMTIDTVGFKVGATGGLEAAVKATVYLAPKAEGATAGATPQGPPPATAQPAAGGAPSGAPTTPTAASVP